MSLLLTNFFPSAEFILSAIGAGATANSDIDWSNVWKGSPEAVQLEAELDCLQTEGRSMPPVGNALRKEFATPWTYQFAVLYRRSAEAYWRDPTYLMAKITLNVVSGLFVGFTFFNAKDTLQGTQNKLFVSCISSILLFAPYL